MGGWRSDRKGAMDGLKGEKVVKTGRYAHTLKTHQDTADRKICGEYKMASSVWPTLVLSVTNYTRVAPFLLFSYLPCLSVNSILMKIHMQQFTEIFLFKLFN